MIVSITSDARVVLLDPANFRGFHVSPSMTGVDREHVAACLATIGARMEGDHAWVPISWLKANGSALGSEWMTGFEAMVIFARSKGWVDDPGDAIRAHIEWPDDA